MSQSDFVIANQTFPATRAEMNVALQALASQSQGATEPSTTYAGQPWGDTTANLLKRRNDANTAWITVAAFDVGNNRWEIRANVYQASSAAGITFKNSSGTTILSIADNGDLTVTGTIAGLANAVAKTTPVDADHMLMIDSAASNVLKKLTWANLKTAVYAAISLGGPLLTNSHMLKLSNGADVASGATLNIGVDVSVIRGFGSRGRVN